MGDSVSADPETLRTAAKRLDALYNSAGTTLRATDQEIADGRDGWQDTASTAFTQFTTYLDGRRTLLQQQPAELSEDLTTTAATLHTQDQSRAAAANRLRSSLDL